MASKALLVFSGVLLVALLVSSHVAPASATEEQQLTKDDAAVVGDGCPCFRCLPCPCCGLCCIRRNCCHPNREVIPVDVEAKTESHN